MSLKFSKEITKVIKEIEEIARGYGLEFFETRFEMVDYEIMNQLVSYEGFPSRYPHWRFGMEYERFTKSYTYGLHRISEMVINNDPCYAYLLEGNSITDVKLVIAHVFAHCDFFKNNLWFAETNRKMLNEIGNHGVRVRKYIDLFGFDEVERFLNICFSIDNLIDYYSPFIRRERKKEKEESHPHIEVKKIKSKKYLEDYINPKEFLEAEKKKIEEELKKEKKLPPEPQRDVILFLIENAPLEKWQRNIIAMVREEGYYFAPQRMTKIMNEGWASYWHSKILTEKVLKEEEIIDFADLHSQTMGGGELNPYKIGIELWRDIEERWNKGQFGKEWEECEDISEKRSWDRHLSLGREKIFEVRKIYNDVSFIDEFLTPEFCKDHKLFSYDFNPKSGYYEISSREFKKIKEKLLFQLTNFGEPFIYVENGNYENRGELLLVHKHQGVDLRKDWAIDTLQNIFTIWKRPVHIHTIFEEKPQIWTHNGNEFKISYENS